MSYDQIIKRLEDLHNVLAYCSAMQSRGKIYTFKVAERICINQERGALLTRLADGTELRDYTIPAHIEAKVKFTIEKIESTNWGWYRISDHINLSS